MSVKKIKVLLLVASTLTASEAFCAETTPDVTVFALKEYTGSVWNTVTNEAEHLASYKITVNNNANTALTLGKNNKICFYLDDNNGKKLISHGAQLELLSSYKPRESRSGTIYFSTTELSLLTLPYVKVAFGSSCK